MSQYASRTVHRLTGLLTFTFSKDGQDGRALGVVGRSCTHERHARAHPAVHRFHRGASLLGSSVGRNRQACRLLPLAFPPPVHGCHGRHAGDEHPHFRAVGTLRAAYRRRAASPWTAHARRVSGQRSHRAGGSGIQLRRRRRSGAHRRSSRGDDRHPSAGEYLRGVHPHGTQPIKTLSLVSTLAFWADHPPTRPEVPDCCAPRASSILESIHWFTCIRPVTDGG